MQKIKMVEFKDYGDERGQLVVIEGGNTIPFDIKRVFYIYKTVDGTVRGKHANIDSEFVLINVQGSCKIMFDDGENKDFVLLDRPNFGIYLNKMVWKEMYDFSEDSVLLVLASEYYNENEYVRDYDEFKKMVNEGYWKEFHKE